ncbi:DUF998 domain-containing protein [Microbacterium sp. W1N]|uniref:DUF998 domain-containing protein n=1 Tax=Microbacterium festucae TaxID=2977531 RepID=UPI0021C04802|nr:DUF998 domain-containing protein [Microbacterium festucae]MCT9819626.1 DUF998 domain-containing protein [Microbacterium festucae]
MSTTVPSRPGARGAVDTSSARTRESLALGVGAVAFVVAALAALAVFRFSSAPIGGPGSIGQFAALAGAVAAMLAFAAGRYVTRDRGRPVAALEVFDVAALALAHGIIALLAWTLLTVIMEESFIGAEVFALPLLALAGAVAAVTAYAAFLSATRIDLSLLATILAVFLVLGVIASMLTATDPQWWKMNLSALGMTDDLSAFAFNLTLIVAGALVTTLARYATTGVPSSHPRGARNVRLCLIIVGVFLACVGIFHVDVHFWIHNTVATGMVAAFAVAAIRMRVWIPGIPRGFVVLGWVFLAVIVVLGVLFGVGYYTLTAVELVAGLLIFSWIILFIRSAAALQTDTDDVARPEGSLTA